MIIKAVSAKEVFDSRKEKTIFISIKTNVGNFSASAPNGKSKGKHEAKPYKKSLGEEIKTIGKFSDYFSEENLEKFSDLHRVEDIVDGHIGANTLFAFESAILKAIAKEQKKEIWQILNPNAKKFPRLVGNCIGGGKHSDQEKDKKSDSVSEAPTSFYRKPDFQEFLIIPNSSSVKESFEIIKTTKQTSKFLLKERDENFKEKRNDEDAWITSLNDKEVFKIIKSIEIPMGVDIAASSFFSRKKYLYKNPILKRTGEEQFDYVSNLIKNFDLFYIEDPFQEEDFGNFTKLMEKFPQKLIVGDDLTVTDYKRTEKAIKEKSVNAIIVKPNQNGSLLEVKRVCELAKSKDIKIIFSHRSGETEENILADLAFGFQTDFLKCGITGKEREAKIKRLIEIEERLKR